MASHPSNAAKISHQPPFRTRKHERVFLSCDFFEAIRAAIQCSTFGARTPWKDALEIPNQRPNYRLSTIFFGNSKLSGRPTAETVVVRLKPRVSSPDRRTR